MMASKDVINVELRKTQEIWDWDMNCPSKCMLKTSMCTLTWTQMKVGWKSSTILIRLFINLKILRAIRKQSHPIEKVKL